MPLPFSRRALQTAPSFSRDFAGLKTLDHGVGPAITFTRASDATFFDASGTLQTASNDAPRFDHDPATGNASRGLLIEEARTNLLVRSADFTTTWTVDNSGATNPVITANHASAPDGTLTADRIELDKTGGTFSRVQQSLSSVASSVYTFSVFLKTTSAGTTANVGIRVSSTGINVVVTDVWQRFSVSLPSAETVATSQILLFDSIAGNDETADILAWGAQLEAGAFPTSYIPTTAAAATRSADSAVVTPISSFYNQAEGTVFAEYRFPEPIPSSGFPNIYSFSDGGDDNMVRLIGTATTNPFSVRSGGGSDQANIGPSAVVAGTIYRHAGAYRQDDFAASRNGGAVGTDLSGAAPSGLTVLRIGASGSTSNRFTGHIRKIAYYPRRLSNTLLQQLTT